MNYDCVQGAFCQSCNPSDLPQVHHHSTLASRGTVPLPEDPCISSQAVSAVLEQSLDQEHLPPLAFLLPQLVQSIKPRELSDVCPLPRDKLMAMQCADHCLSCMLLYSGLESCCRFGWPETQVTPDHFRNPCTPTLPSSYQPGHGERPQLGLHYSKCFCDDTGCGNLFTSF